MWKENAEGGRTAGDEYMYACMRMRAYIVCMFARCPRHRWLRGGAGCHGNLRSKNTNELRNIHERVVCNFQKTKHLHVFFCSSMLHEWLSQREKSMSDPSRSERWSAADLQHSVSLTRQDQLPRSPLTPHSHTRSVTKRHIYSHSDSKYRHVNILQDTDPTLYGWTSCSRWKDSRVHYIKDDRAPTINVTYKKAVKLKVWMTADATITV